MFQGDGGCSQSPERWDAPGSGPVARQERVLHSQSCSYEFCQGHLLFPGGVTHRIPKDHGPEGDTFPKVLKHQGGLSFCPWCGKEGHNEGTVVNYLCTGHYHLGLVCERCLWYFTTSSNMMQCHVQGCQPTHAHDDSPSDEEPAARNGGDGNKSRWYHLQAGPHCPEAPYCSCHQLLSK